MTNTTMSDKLADAIRLFDDNLRRVIQSMIDAGGTYEAFDPKMSAQELIVLLSRNNIVISCTFKGDQ